MAMNFIAELKRRNVFRVAAAYTLIAWVVLQAVDFAVELINAPAWVLQIFFIVAAIGLLAVVVVSWIYEFTPEGIKKESEIDRSQSITPQTGRKLDRVIIIFLGLAVSFLLADKFLGGKDVGDYTLGDAEVQAVAAAEDPVIDAPEDRSVAVLPFAAMSSGPDDEYFADGLTEEILNSLAQLPELLVTARTSAFSFKGKDLPVSEIADALGVQHIVEGSVRRSGERIRVTAQLIRADDGFHLWSDTYDSTSADTIAVQENIAEAIAQALDVVLDDSKRQAMQLAGLRNVEAFTLYQKARYHYQIAHGEAESIPNLREANRLIERVLELVPSYAPAYVEHSDLFAHYVLDDLINVTDDMVTQEDIDSAMENAVQDYTLAIEHARNDAERHSFEYDRAFLARQWQGLKGRAQLVMSDGACATNNWMAPFALTFSLADDYAAYAKNIRECDPLVSIEWFNEARALIWAGRLEEALAIAKEGVEVAPGSWLNIMYIQALIGLGRFEEADRVVLTRMQYNGDVLMARMQIAGAKGDRQALDRVYVDLMKDPYSSSLQTMAYYAWSGQRQRANEFATELDQSDEFHYALTMYTLWCTCGAPFDLESTPNFAQLIEDSGLPWPPESPITYPLKDW